MIDACERAVLRRLIDQVSDIVPRITMEQALDLIAETAGHLRAGAPPASMPLLLDLQLADVPGLPATLEERVRCSLAGMGHDVDLAQVQGVLVAIGEAVDAPYPV
jgi:hypothetical protein